MAIFVEGHTELIFVRELILKMFDFSNISLDCYTLFTDDRFVSTEYAFPNDRADYYYQIINVGNDQGVISRMRNRANYMWNQGFSRLVGLRDMYSKEYREVAGSGKINLEVIQHFIDGHNDAKPTGDVIFCFAIMEVEAWILGITDLFLKIHPTLETTFIEAKINIDISKVDPEQAFYHPAQILSDVLNLADLRYDKKKGEVNSFMGLIEKEHLIQLYSDKRCNSFSHFCSACAFPEDLYK